MDVRLETSTGKSVTCTCSLVIPMYRESHRINRTIERISGSPIDRDDLEIIFVDDGSRDGTFESASALIDEHGLNATVIRLPNNRGKGAAVAAGMREARGAYRVFTDADLSTSVNDVAACFGVLADGVADVVVGSRAHVESVVSTAGPSARPLLGRSYNRLLRLLRLTRLRDTQCGLKGFTGAASAIAFDDLRTEGFAFDVEVLARAERAGLRIVEMPVRWEHVPRSRVRPVRDSLAMSRDAIALRRRLLLNRSVAPEHAPEVEAAERATAPGVPAPGR